MKVNREGFARDAVAALGFARSTRRWVRWAWRFGLVTDAAFCAFQVWGVVSTGVGSLALWGGLFLALSMVLWVELRFGLGEAKSQP